MRSRLPVLLLPALATLAGCEAQPASGAPSDPGRRAPIAEDVAVGLSTSDARFVKTILGFDGPESVRYDPDQDVYFVSNMTGYGSAKDGNGYIARVPAGDPGVPEKFVVGGQRGAQLDSPKGLAIHGDTLWTADIDQLRGFDRRTGAPLATVDFAPQHAVLLNDVAVGPDGALYITDTGIIMGDVGTIPVGPFRVFRLGPGHAISVVTSKPRLPNGVTWDPVGQRWIIVSFDPFDGQIVAMRDGDTAQVVLRNGSGKLDGVEVMKDGSILFTSWADSSLHRLRGKEDQFLIRDLPVPADIGVDTRRNRVAIPLSMLDRVQLWDLRGAAKSGGH